MDWINDPAQWTENITAPSFSPSFLRELLLAGGSDRQGNPNFRLVWGQDFETAKIWSTEEQGWFPRYWFRTMRAQKITDNPVNGLAMVQFQYKKVGIPRFFMESRLSPETAYADDLAIRHESSEWWTFFELCEHRDGCCVYADSLHTTCHGHFRLPTQQDAREAGAYRAWLNAQAGLDPNQPVAATFKERAYIEARERDKQHREKLEAEIAYASKNFVNTHWTQLSDDPSVVKHGKFHFLGK